MFHRNLAVAICCALGHMVVYYMPFIVKVAANVFDIETRQVRTFLSQILPWCNVEDASYLKLIGRATLHLSQNQDL
jgi:hypothetical protein